MEWFCALSVFGLIAFLIYNSRTKKQARLVTEAQGIVEQLVLDMMREYPDLEDQEIARLVLDDLQNARVRHPELFMWATSETVGRVRRTIARQYLKEKRTARKAPRLEGGKRRAHKRWFGDRIADVAPLVRGDWLLVESCSDVDKRGATVVVNFREMRFEQKMDLGMTSSSLLGPSSAARAVGHFCETPPGSLKTANSAFYRETVISTRTGGVVMAHVGSDEQHEFELGPDWGSCAD